jgi:hypothetical protein
LIPLLLLGLAIALIVFLPLGLFGIRRRRL